MIITCDIGNTSTKLGLYEGEERLAFLIVDSKVTTAFKSFILQMIYKLSLRGDQIEDSIIVSVVPAITPIVNEALKEIIHKDPIIVDNNNYHGIQIDGDVEGDVSNDLLVISAYAYQKYKQELIIVSLGSTSTIFHVTGDGKFKHQIIAPGFNSFINALPSHNLNASCERKGTFLVSDSLDAMMVGVIDGYIGMVKYLVAGMRKSLGEQIRVISCGGAAKEIMTYISNSDYFEPDLVSNGLSYIYYRYVK